MKNLLKRVKRPFCKARIRVSKIKGFWWLRGSFDYKKGKIQ
jgi:hypothetical protein